MAKQTFTTGQVLSAAQMTSLQQTAMGGGSTTAKTASYTLVAADAGTVIQMNSASATTITVNTALFAAGDTVQIQNIGAGVCTVTAGTATVNTAGSLALTQYEGGSLYFNTTSAALFFDYVQAASAITGTSFSAVSSVSLPNSTFSSTYTNYKIIFNLTAAAGAISETRIRMRASGADNTTSGYYAGGTEVNYAAGASSYSANGTTYLMWGNISTSTPQNTQFEITMMSPQASSTTAFNINGGKGTWTWKAMTGFFEGTTAFDAMTFYADAGTITGSYKVYGIANS